MVDLSKEQFTGDQQHPYSVLTWIGLGVVLLFALWLRLPFISTGLPFFYQEDEGHHFNRTVEMVKRGQWNPEYFHKPSLHFYLRMPVVGLSFLHSVRQGHIRSVRQIQTRDDFGLAGYSFTASHSGIVKWNRALSVLFSLLLVVGTFFLCLGITRSPPPSIIAAALVAVSPDLIEHSAIIGVDVLMALMSLLAVIAGIYAVRRGGVAPLLLCGLLCGLALSSKYNAAPILLLPIVVWLLQHRRSLSGLAIAMVAPIAGFLIGSPFVLSSFPLFLDHMAYEVWHYGVAGHAGHSTEPGLPQLLFYTSWLGKSAFGWIGLFMAALGVISVVAKPTRVKIACVVFPLLFLLFMVMQKTNFSRNMLVVIPFLGVFVGVFLATVLEKIFVKRYAVLGVSAVLLVCLALQPLALALQLREAAIDPLESRIDFIKWLEEFSADDQEPAELAVAGQLQLPADAYNQPRIAIEDLRKNDILDLYLQGYQFVAAGNLEEFDFDPQQRIKSFDGVTGKQRILRNPKIEILQLSQSNEYFEMAALKERVLEQGRYHTVMEESDDGVFDCQQGIGSEDYCWLNSRLNLLTLKRVDDSSVDASDIKTLIIRVMNPWKDQVLTLSVGDFNREFQLAHDPEQWQEVIIELPASASADNAPIFLELEKVLSPKAQAMSDDARRLGIAVNGIKIF